MILTWTPRLGVVMADSLLVVVGAEWVGRGGLEPPSAPEGIVEPILSPRARGPPRVLPAGLGLVQAVLLAQVLPRVVEVVELLATDLAFVLVGHRSSSDPLPRLELPAARSVLVREALLQEVEPGLVVVDVHCHGLGLPGV